MRLYSALQIGEYHVNHCEDYLFFGEIGANKWLLAVMDGCTMAKDSYFASTLVGKLLRKIAKERLFAELYELEPVTDAETTVRFVLQNLVDDLNRTRNDIMLDRLELLTTLVISVVDVENKNGVVLALGDGLVCIDGKITEFDQDNKPDYLGYHLDKDFDYWYKMQQQKLHFDNFADFSMATDGVTSFTKIKDITNEGLADPVNFLLSDCSGNETDEMLNLKLKKLEHVFGLKPTDDLAIVRMILFMRILLLCCIYVFFQPFASAAQGRTDKDPVLFRIKMSCQAIRKDTSLLNIIDLDTLHGRPVVRIFYTKNDTIKRITEFSTANPGTERKEIYFLQSKPCFIEVKRNLFELDSGFTFLSELVESFPPYKLEPGYMPKLSPIIYSASYYFQNGIRYAAVVYSDNNGITTEVHHDRADDLLEGMRLYNYFINYAGKYRNK
jgi:hypothetical protein